MISSFQDRLQEENTKVKLLENIYPYLSYNDAEFTGSSVKLKNRFNKNY